MNRGDLCFIEDVGTTLLGMLVEDVIKFRPNYVPRGVIGPKSDEVGIW